MCGTSPSGSWPSPFAVGLLAFTDPADTTGRSVARLDLALDTYKLGYFLIDIIEIDLQGTGYLAAELLLNRAEPAALITRGPIDAAWLHALADRHRLVIRSASPQ
jgi:hypothetical protein